MKIIKLSSGSSNSITLDNDLDRQDELMQIDEDVEVKPSFKADEPILNRQMSMFKQVDSKSLDSPRRFVVKASEEAEMAAMIPDKSAIKAAKRLAKQLEKDNKQPAKRGRPRSPMTGEKFGKLAKKLRSIDTSDFHGDTLVMTEQLYDGDVLTAESFYDGSEMTYKWHI